MSTIHTPEVAYKLLSNDGIYPGDPQMFSIWRYEIPGDINYVYKICATVELHRDFLLNDVHGKNPYVLDPCLLWSRDEKFTPEGDKELERLKKLLEEKEK